VLADPAESCVARKRTLEHGCRVDKGAVTEWADLVGDAPGQCLKPVAHELVIVTAKGVARDVGALGVGKNIPAVARAIGQVVHAHRNHTQGAGYQFVGSAALAAVAGHVVHFAVAAGIEPVEQMGFVIREIHAGNSELLKAEFACPLLQSDGQSRVVDRCHGCERSSKLADKHTGFDACGGTLRIIAPMPELPTQRSLYTVKQVRQIDRAAIDAGQLPGIELMRRAAAAAFAALRERWPAARRILVVAGNGNNGGDAFLLAHLARSAGLDVRVLALGPESTGDAAQARATWRESGGGIEVIDAKTGLGEADVIVDGLFGTGMTRAPAGVAATLVERMNAHHGGKLALDVPSGLDADLGTTPGVVFEADATISFVAWKRGLFTADGVDCCGHLQLDTLDIPAAIHLDFGADVELLDEGILSVLPPRKGNVNKGRFGHVLAVGGDEGMAGAIALSAEAALRVGAGLVSVATRAAHVGTINGIRAELMARGVDGPQSLQGMMDRASVIAIGPGLGQSAWGHAHWDTAVHAGKCCVLDADALNLLAREPVSLPALSVLTPHPGEAARLLNCEVSAVQHDRFAAARELAARYSAVVVLKGAGSLIANVDGRLALCPFGNPGMASAGMGDVLTGVIAGLLAQGLDPWDAARLGVVAHAIAGDRAAADQPRGMIASDLFAFVRAFVNGRPS
jgi:ADP-dependent NAD(P)H-hydrate dehydratase / NAD(P)H-hydrate epimerase